MKIKQLEWENFGPHEAAKTSFGISYVATLTGRWRTSFGMYRESKNMDITSAKLACQADFERRVRECVEEEVCVWRCPTVTPDDEGFIELETACGKMDLVISTFCPHCGGRVKVEESQ